MKKGPWQYKAECQRCKWRTDISYGMEQLQIRYNKCPRCGQPIKKSLRALFYPSLYGWDILMIRWINDYVWWKPWTWGNGYWEHYEDEY